MKECTEFNFYVEQDELILDIGEKKLGFRSMGYIEPIKNADGEVFVDKPQLRYRKNKNLGYNKNCDDNTEFTAFKVEGIPESKGVYIWYIDNGRSLSYIGEGVNLKKRFSFTGYGKISPRNCFVGGQSTNCKMNHEVLKMWKEGKVFHLYIFETEDHKDLEKKLIKMYHPELNKKDNKAISDDKIQCKSNEDHR